MLHTVEAPSAFELCHDRPGRPDVHYRVDFGRLEWSENLADFLPGDRVPLDEGLLLSLATGTAAPPDATGIPGVHRLAFGTVVRVDTHGVTVSRREPELPPRSTDLRTAVRAALAELGDDYAIAYSGGLSSAFVAACAVAAGHRPVLLHAEMGAVPKTVGGLELRTRQVDLAAVLDHRTVTGAELTPPLPDVEAPRRLFRQLSDGPLVGGALMDDLVATKLHDVGRGVRDWRLLTCEPFHVGKKLDSLADARNLLDNRAVEVADATSVPVGPPAEVQADLPGLTPKGRELLDTMNRGSLAVWKEHLESLGPVLGRMSAALAERGDGGMVLPAVDARVLSAATATNAARAGRIRHGLFQTQLPMRRALAKHGLAGLRSAPGFWLRKAAAAHLFTHREALAAQWERECALADMGLLDAAVVIRMLRQASGIAEHALPVLRLFWIDQWLRGRA